MTNGQNIQEPVQTAPKKKSGALKWVLIGGCGCVLVIVILAGLFGGGIYWGLKKFNAMIDPTIGAHAQAILEGDIDKAYSYCSEEFKAGTDFQTYQAFVADYKEILTSPDRSFTNFEMKNNLMTVSGSVTTSDGSYYPITYDLIKKGDTWYIYNIRIGN
ncbi:MAG: DUF4864 domain-containing protein [Candidatus Aureabacteria bacterium]|nr:DUF4864 domain-containing protein [Candidatus Auribacterota bacterium]